MFSFFKTKKPSPPSSPESEPIPSSSDFVMVDPNKAGAGQGPLYPNFNQQFGHPSGIPPALPTRPPLLHSESVHSSNYINGVPFKLSPEISSGDLEEITRIQVDDILALITSKMEITKIDYDFTLERSLLQADTDSTDSEEAGE